MNNFRNVQTEVMFQGPLLKTGSGVLIEYKIVRTFYNDSKNEEDNSESFECSVYCKKSGIYLVVLNDVALFKKIEPVLIKVFTKLYAHITPEDSMTRGSYSKTDTIITALSPSNNLIDKNVESEEDVFRLVFHLIESVIFSYQQYTDDETNGILDNHVKMFNDTTFDTLTKIEAGLNPKESQLGFNNYAVFNHVMSHPKFTSDNVNALKYDPALLETFIRFVIAQKIPDEDQEETLGDFEMPKEYETFNRYLGFRFFEMPVQNKDFLSFLSKSKISELGNIEEIFSKHYPIDLCFEIYNHSLFAAHGYEKKKSLLDAIDFINAKQVKMVESGDTEIAINWFHNYIISNHSKRGFMTLVKDVSKTFEINCFIEFAELHETLDDLFSQWMLRPPMKNVSRFSCDFVLLKMSEKLGTMNTFKLLYTIHESEIKFNLLQLLEIITIFDELILVPVEWWRSLISTGDFDD